MEDSPNIAILGTLIGDSARSLMLRALMGGQALTATELAQCAGISAQTASSHLRKLQEGGLLDVCKQGRHRYFRLADHSVAETLESFMVFAFDRGHGIQTGPRDEKLRRARICYDHLAGEKGVLLYGKLLNCNMIIFKGASLTLTISGRAFMMTLGINVEKLEQERRPLCRTCLDWSERKDHLGGALGKALLERFKELNWVEQKHGSRVITFTAKGERSFQEMLTTYE